MLIGKHPVVGVLRSALQYSGAVQRQLQSETHRHMQGVGMAVGASLLLLHTKIHHRAPTTATHPLLTPPNPPKLLLCSSVLTSWS